MSLHTYIHSFNQEYFLVSRKCHTIRRAFFGFFRSHLCSHAQIRGCVSCIYYIVHEWVVRVYFHNRSMYTANKSTHDPGQHATGYRSDTYIFYSVHAKYIESITNLYTLLYMYHCYNAAHARGRRRLDYHIIVYIITSCIGIRL